MLTYDELPHHPRKFLALTGLTPKEFKQLLPAFAQAYARRYPANKTHAGKARQRQCGGGRKSTLETVEQKLLFARVYQKTYPVQTLLGELFDLSQSRTNDWIHRLLPILKDALDALDVLPSRDPQQFAEHEQQQREAHDYIIDGTERRRQRPKNAEKQVLHYSGKKKTPSDKNVVIAQRRTTRIGYLSPTYPGKTHDKKMADTESVQYPHGSKLYKDTGFQGYEPSDCRTYQPKKSHARRS
jgi:DDE superfamily endonuclease/Helix-turn-helix of DDE superfamily endonuclease